MKFPTTTHQLYAWNAVLLVAYIIVAGILDFLYRSFRGEAYGTGLRPADYMFNGATFSASAMIGVGIYDEAVLRLIGDTTIYLVLAGLSGFWYTISALRPKGPGRRMNGSF